MDSREFLEELEKTKLAINNCQDKIEENMEIKTRLENILIESLLFNPTELTKVLALLVENVEGKKYVPVFGHILENYCNVCQYAVLYDESEYRKNKNKIKRVTDLLFGECIVVCIKKNVSSRFLKKKNTTYMFLLDKYFNGRQMYDANLQYRIFEGHEYIKDFICYLVEYSIANEKSINYDDMVICLNNYLKDNKKSKILQKK